KIGTTGKGIGPAYLDKVRRQGLRICDLAEKDELEAHCRAIISELDQGWNEFEDSSPAELAEEYNDYYQQLEELIVDSPAELDAAYRRGEKILFEGAQGSLLDIDFGTYPYVTSSNPTVGGVVTGSGFPGHRLETVLGIAKAYTTRVGEGPFPAELKGELGQWLQEKGGEFGATTGRPRRCGWLDLKILRYTARVNGFTDLVLTKLDVLSGRETVKVAVDYRGSSGQPVNGFPPRCSDLETVEPVYEELPGWQEDISECTAFSQLPAAARDYVKYIENNIQVPISYLSVGPGRRQFINRA
ncbi:MAG: adenylosuccinate synthetase, partial [bacterium]